MAPENDFLLRRSFALVCHHLGPGRPIHHTKPVQFVVSIAPSFFSQVLPLSCKSSLSQVSVEVHDPIGGMHELLGQPLPAGDCRRDRQRAAVQGRCARDCMRLLHAQLCVRSM